ncbi:MAG: hypothetical protein PHN88_04550 [Ignavibacteria bacterium]|nr:hypothetical protein [Ignavibacteria bacterium]
MNTNILAILLVIYIFASIIVGIIYGNKKLAFTEGHTIRGWYFTWFVIKQALISFILFAIAVLIVELFSKQDVWGYFMVIILGISNFFYARNKVSEEYRIMFKPGEGILTPEGRAKLEKYMESAK